MQLMSSAIPRRVDHPGGLSALREIEWEAYLRDPSGDTSALSFFSGFGFGLLVGAIVAILLAPAAGRTIRQQLYKTSIELRERGVNVRR
jgi:hypothetical protein